MVRIQEVAAVWSTGSSFTVTPPQNPANGDALILCVFISQNSTTPITVSSVSSTGATWAAANAANNNDGSAYAVDAEIWLAPNVSGASGAVTITLSGTPLAAFAFFAEYSNLLSSPTDKTASNTGSSATADSGTTGTATQPMELCVAALVSGTAYSFNGSPSNGFTQIDTRIGFKLSGEYLENNIETTQTVDASDSTGSYSGIWAGVMATFKVGQILTAAQYSGANVVTAALNSGVLAQPRDLTVNIPTFPILPPTGQMAAPATYSGIGAFMDYLDLQSMDTIRANLTVQPPSTPQNLGQIAPPANYSGIGIVTDYLDSQFVDSIRPDLTVQPPLYATFPPALFSEAPPAAYTAIGVIVDYLERLKLLIWPTKLTVQPPVVWTRIFTVSDSAHGLDAAWTYSFIVSDSGHGSDAVAIGIQANDSGHGADALASLTANLSLGDSGHGSDLLHALTVTLTINDVAHGTDYVISAAKAGVVSISVLSRPVNIQVDQRSVNVLINGYSVSVTIEPDQP